MTVPELNTRGWYKSSFSAQANDCVETGQLLAGGIAVRDSKNPHEAPLVFTADAWSAFVAHLSAGALPVA